MADFTSPPMAADYSGDAGSHNASASPSNSLTKLTNATGAIVSLALVAGIGVWGYKLLVRDVSGIPVVRAAQGEMRVRPQKPGGQLARHQGLSVNTVAAEGSAGKPADQLRLAPRAVDLADEDQPIKSAMVAPVPQQALAAEATAEIKQPARIDDVAAAIQSGSVDDLVAQLTDGVTPLEALDTQAEAAPVVASIAPENETAQSPVPAAVRNAPGVRNSLRPRRRPADAAARAIVQPASLDLTEAIAAVATELDAEDLPAGTRLVQLGAFDSPEIARTQWDKLGGRFDAYMQGKTRIIQKASSGGRVFYRLRAHGFQDIADARRFCSALVAENADCIPVVTR